ncbi:transglutaminase TgpA family protein [Pseudarthrobacter sp. J1763]|uniref:transglutaminase TgpA family protein n=1 Tax=Pseudarthrobacter sp. J1763 TaxID=3420445 RepID=UPI003D277105
MNQTRTKPGVYPWAMAGAIALAILGCSLSLNGVMRGWTWFMPVATVVMILSCVLALTRTLRFSPLLTSLSAFVALALTLTSIFFRQHSILGLIPTAETFTEVGRLLSRAGSTVVNENAPVVPNAGIVLVTCTVLGLMVILVDALAVPLAMPATSGLALIAILVVPAMLKPLGVGWLGFIAGSCGYLLILAVGQWFAPKAAMEAESPRASGHFGRASAAAAAALVLTLAVPLAIPGFTEGAFPQGSRLAQWGKPNGLNPMISLGSSLRSPSGGGQITYATDSASPLYLRSTTIDSFSGDTWGPDDRNSSRRTSLESIDPPVYQAGLEISQSLTSINTGNFVSPYLPAPYPPSKVSGLRGDWTWDPETLTAKGQGTNTENQRYLVESTAPKITAAHLNTASTENRDLPAIFTQLPSGIPAVVSRTAETLGRSASTPFAKALAIQNFLRGPEFSYSLDAPVQGGYDGTGLDVLGEFLTKKSGYCVHFSSAMAVMARLLGIPSRIAVGYAPGRLTGNKVTLSGQDPFAEYAVDARDAHAWPELYFEGVGWVPFEPTPSRGVVPDYTVGASASASTNQDENNDGLINDPRPTTTASAATPVPSTTPTVAAGAPSQKTDPSTWLIAIGVFLAAVLLALTPRLVRERRRSRRLRGPADELADASALSAALAISAWHELEDLGHDFGIPRAAHETPRVYSGRLRGSGLLGDGSNIDAPAHRAVQAINQDFERATYGRVSTLDGLSNTEANRAQTVRETLLTHVPLGVRWRAQWLPPSTFAHWAAVLRHPVNAARSYWRR